MKLIKVQRKLLISSSIFSKADSLIRFFQRRAQSLFSQEDKERLQEAIRSAEKRTSGEVRVYIENHCRYLEATDRAVELFAQLQMHQTELRNGVLIYLAIKDRQLAIWGDQGIHEKVGAPYWEEIVSSMLSSFDKKDFTNGLSNCIASIGEALSHHFPYDGSTDRNELSDEIVFGR